MVTHGEEEAQGDYIAILIKRLLIRYCITFI